MTDQEKLLKTFDEIGIHYIVEECDEPDLLPSKYVCIWICGEENTLQQAKNYDHLIEFCDGRIASY
jgi:hypothetical protein